MMAKCLCFYCRERIGRMMLQSRGPVLGPVLCSVGAYKGEIVLTGKSIGNSA